MQIKWSRDFKESWCWMSRGRVSVVTLPAPCPGLHPAFPILGNLYAKAAKQLINAAPAINQKINCSI